MESALFDVTQEALSNIVAHPGDTAANVDFWANRREIGVSVSDSGNRFDPEALPERTGGQGMTEMRERAASVSGKLTVESSPAFAGITVTMVLPMSQRSSPVQEGGMEPGSAP